MADNYLEYHREEYERRKDKWLAKKKHTKSPARPLLVTRPDNEAL